MRFVRYSSATESLLEYVAYVELGLEIVKRPPCRFWIKADSNPEDWPKFPTGFKVQPKRWVVERTFAWIGRNRRLSKEYDYHTESTESHIYIAMSRLILRRMTEC